ncbi:NTP transferase domain-containing protein [uncultured Paracoccus sp.]|uniref:nucleotidyltransferase family protein n=1 Tax=uncultured Paracoccus sp. TaxID=189685 RepID=UPI00260F518B|nr:NTP transferase domain-containing protein [uncultured Paracoccus sp.]
MPHIRTGLLLAAGASRRFGPEDKLLALVAGQPLLSHAAAAMRAAVLDRRIAVVSSAGTAALLDGFEVIRIAQGEQSDSLRAGLAAAGAPDCLLIALGDMPLVTAALLDRIVAACTDDQPSASREADGPPMPPACFPASWLPRLAELSGDQGAGRLLRDLPASQMVEASGQLPDIDTPEALRRLFR